jgi:hypothetical protein
MLILCFFQMMNATQRKSIILGAPFALGQELSGVELAPLEVVLLLRSGVGKKRSFQDV